MIRFAALIALAITCPARADDATGADFVYFAPGAPGIVRLQATFEGKPVGPIWTAAVDKFFDYLDRDGNGKLDEKERAVLGPQTGRRRNDPVAAFAESDLAGRLKFERDADSVDKAAFAAALKTAGFGPIEVSFQAARDDAAALTNALFKHLDSDGDGKLSGDELRTARDRLAMLDVNEDEWLTAAELTSRGIPAARQLLQPGRRPAPEPAESNSVDFLLLNGAGLPAVKQLLAARGKPKATTLARAELGMNEKAFAEFDRDTNGSLDTDELLAWLGAKPLLAIDLKLAVDPTKSTVRPVGTVAVGGTRFDIAAPTGAGVGEWTATAYQIRTGFKALAKEGRVPKANLKDQPALSGAFGFLDRDGDDTVNEKELEASLAVLAALANCRAGIAIVDRGRSLFELVDANRDGQLSPRELASLPAIAKACADGPLARTDVPRLIGVQSTSAGIRMFSNPAAPQTFVDAMTPAPARATPADGPAWFVKMDRNGDGDVSRREFLGPLDRFRKLDADGDGLISSVEAKAK
jgi:Ca2+-binding EF-hand superfamily protein